MLSCHQCSLKFDQSVWYDLHVSLVHCQEDEIEILKQDFKKEQGKNDFIDKSNNFPISIIYDEDYQREILKEEINEILECDTSPNSNGEQKKIEQEKSQEQKENNFQVRSSNLQTNSISQENEILEDVILTNSNEDKSSLEQENSLEKEVFKSIIEIYSDDC